MWYLVTAGLRVVVVAVVVRGVKVTFTSQLLALAGYQHSLTRQTTKQFDSNVAI
jgi:hypothetical protein